ncbi:MAG: group 1 glycosyl transferase [Actinomycetia bacterium]|nr:group 1 glycosyl transferase [Actinomycetes bacterium]
MRVPRAVVRAVARVKPHLPASSLPVLDTLRSFAGDGPIVATPSFRRVLALGAHPDDEVVGCGGLLALLADAGAEVHVCFATDGEATIGASLPPEEVARRRRAEAEASCRVLGACPPRFLGHPDGSLAEHAAALADDVRRLVDELRPDVVLAPWALDGHRDHRAVFAAVPAGVELWGYETWTPLTPNRIVDVSAVFPRKEQALACYETAHLAFDVGAMLALNRYRSVHGLSGRGHAEAYLTRA